MNGHISETADGDTGYTQTAQHASPTGRSTGTLTFDERPSLHLFSKVIFKANGKEFLEFPLSEDSPRKDQGSLRFSFTPATTGDAKSTALEHRIKGKNLSIKNRDREAQTMTAGASSASRTISALQENLATAERHLARKVSLAKKLTEAEQKVKHLDLQAKKINNLWRDQVKKLETERDDAINRANSTVRGEIDSLSNRLDVIKRRFNVVEKELSTTRIELGTNKVELANTIAELATTKADLRTTKKDLSRKETILKCTKGLQSRPESGKKRATTQIEETGKQKAGPPNRNGEQAKRKKEVTIVPSDYDDKDDDIDEVALSRPAKKVRKTQRIGRKDSQIEREDEDYAPSVE